VDSFGLECSMRSGTFFNKIVRGHWERRLLIVDEPLLLVQLRRRLTPQFQPTRADGASRSMGRPDYCPVDSLLTTKGRRPLTTDGEDAVFPVVGGMITATTCSCFQPGQHTRTPK
jgi:hypothetical protein